MAHSAYHASGRKEFVGREQELAVLRAAWDSARGGAGRLVAIEGEPGIGKTALVRAFLAEVDEPVIKVRGIEGGPPVPWGVFEKILAELPQVSAADRAMELNPQADATIVGETLAEYLHSGPGIVIVVDDAQWADEQSLAALMDAGRRLLADPVLLVLAYQAHDRSPFPASASPGPAKAWRQMLQSGQADRLPLNGMPPEDTLWLAFANGLQGLSLGDAAWLHEATGGNPDYLLDLFPLLSSNPIVIGEAPLPVPANRSSGIMRRFGACGPQARHLLSAAAVLRQRRFSVAKLRDICGIAQPWPHIQEALDHALLEVPQGSGRELRFPQRVTGEAIYWATPEQVRGPAPALRGARQRPGGASAPHRRDRRRGRRPRRRPAARRRQADAGPRPGRDRVLPAARHGLHAAGTRAH